MAAQSVLPQTPELLAQASVARRQWVRRFLLALIASAAGVGAYIALEAARSAAAAPPLLLLQTGEILALGVAAVMGLRALFHLNRALRRRPEALRIYDRGLQWKRGKDTRYQYNWKQLKVYRIDRRRGRQHIALIFQDGVTLRFTRLHGDPLTLAESLEPILAEITGTRMARTLRQGGSVKLREDLIVTPKGVVCGAHKVSWRRIDVLIVGQKLVIKQLDANGSFQTVYQHPTHQIDNVGGLIEVAAITMQTHQPERFGIPTYVT